MAERDEFECQLRSLTGQAETDAAAAAEREADLLERLTGAKAELAEVKTELAEVVTLHEAGERERKKLRKRLDEALAKLGLYEHIETNFPEEPPKYQRRWAVPVVVDERHAAVRARSELIGGFLGDLFGAGAKFLLNRRGLRRLEAED